MNPYKSWLKLTAIPLVIIVISLFATYHFGGFGAPGDNTNLERFIVERGLSNVDIMKNLKKEGFIKNERAFNFALNLEKFGHQIKPGAYKISKSMTAWQVAGTLIKEPYMRWVTIPEGLRKEEVADVLAKELGWDEKKKADWIAEDTAKNSDFLEGVYFPDTYLIPVEESGSDIARRLIIKFEENFEPFAKEAIKQNIKWTTVIKLASIIQRESGGKEDMSLISGILWNRLEKGMRLEVDATIQYARGDVGNGWWAPIAPKDKEIDSPYNTYKNKGLPPHPICNPGLNAIKAALYPEKTDCVFYLHDPLGKIHCTKEYNEHLQNIKEFLK